MSRLVNASSLVCLQNFIGYHLGEQHHSNISKADAENCSEGDKMAFLPQIFGLMPVRATFRSSPYLEIKPIIIQHLDDLKITHTPALIDIIKDLCDNFDRTRSIEGRSSLRPRKNSISDLRQQAPLYKKIRERQNHRCATCGTNFSFGLKEETLDHVIPWRLGGDPPGGWNWQLLCRRCNTAKDTLLSAYTAPEFSNWIFPDQLVKATANGIDLNDRGRYVALRHFGQCQDGMCAVQPKDGELFVVRKCESGFSVLDHLTVLCEQHKDAFGLAVG